MTYRLDIPESIAGSFTRPRIEFAVALYAQSILPFGKASELAQLSQFAFADVIAQHNISRHYSEAELIQDIGYAKS